MSVSERPILHEVQKEFPQFAIWREICGEHVHCIARRIDPATHPHTVVTATLTELRAVLAETARQQPPRPAVPAAPNIARMYSYWTHGKDHYAADRHAADTVQAAFPEVAQIARANRAFVTRAVAHVTAQGITQFADIGAGLPAWPAIHQIAHRHNPTAKVCYIDNDEIVLAHARALLAAGPNVTVAPGDLRKPADILAHPVVRIVIDFDRPACLILASVLHFLEPHEADEAVATLTAALAPGSYLVLSAGTSTGTDPALIERLRAAYTGTSPIAARTEQDITRWFTGLHLLPPGLADVRDWRPGHTARRARTRPTAARFLAGVGCKPPPAL